MQEETGEMAASAALSAESDALAAIKRQLETVMWALLLELVNVSWGFELRFVDVRSSSELAQATALSWKVPNKALSLSRAYRSPVTL